MVFVVGETCLDISKKDRNSTKKGPYVSFTSVNCLPPPSLFFRDCSYLLYDINRQTAPVSILNQFVKNNSNNNDDDGDNNNNNSNLKT